MVDGVIKGQMRSESRLDQIDLSQKPCGASVPRQQLALGAGSAQHCIAAIARTAGRQDQMFTSSTDSDRPGPRASEQQAGMDETHQTCIVAV